MQQAFDFLAGKDAILKSVVDRYGHPKIQLREQGFSDMVHIILEQQVSIASARATFQKLFAHLGVITPENILNTPDEAMRGCGISRQKTLYIKDMAQKVVSGELDFTALANKAEAEIRTELLAIKGVGNWTADVYLMFCLQSPDIIPLGDIAIRSAIKELYGLESVDEITSLAENWKPFRTFASYILWHDYLCRRGRAI